MDEEEYYPDMNSDYDPTNIEPDIDLDTGL